MRIRASMLNKHGEKLCEVDLPVPGSLVMAATTAGVKLVQEAEYATTDVDNWASVTITIEREG